MKFFNKKHSKSEVAAQLVELRLDTFTNVEKLNMIQTGFDDIFRIIHQFMPHEVNSNLVFYRKITSDILDMSLTNPDRTKSLVNTLNLLSRQYQYNTIKLFLAPLMNKSSYLNSIYKLILVFNKVYYYENCIDWSVRAELLGRHGFADKLISEANEHTEIIATILSYFDQEFLAQQYGDIRDGYDLIKMIITRSDPANVLENFLSDMQRISRSRLGKLDKHDFGILYRDYFGDRQDQNLREKNIVENIVTYLPTSFN